MSEPAPARLPHAVDPADAVWRVRLLGGFELDDGRLRLQRLRSRATTLLLARLALAPHRAHGREELCALLWPDADAASGRARLRQTLSLLRTVLEPPGRPQVIDADRRVLRVVPGALWCDALAFEQALVSAGRATAQAWYRGALLPGFDDEWVLEERLRLHAMALARPAGRPLQMTPRSASPGARPEPPPASTSFPPASGTPQRLPAYLTSLVGANDSLARLRALISTHRLVSLLGAGGVGKTRLAIEMARTVTEQTGHEAGPLIERTCLVPLVGCTTAEPLMVRLAAALKLDGRAPTAEHVLESLSGRPTLVVLDGCERLGDDACARIAALAERSSSVHWLLTSRRPLGLDGEQGLMLPGLALPSPTAGVEEAANSAAVQLFVDRARAHRPDFQISEGPCADLVALVRWLDGVPLAIELAAAHARTLSPSDMLALLRAPPHAGKGGESPLQGLAWLSRRGPRSGSDDRAASMQAVIEDSWQLLGAGARQLLRALCRSASGMAQPEVLALAGADAAAQLAAPAALEELVAHAVVRLDEDSQGRRHCVVGEAMRSYVSALPERTPGD